MVKKYYVVWQGKKPGIYTSWEDCQRQVHGFPNAKYKAYTSVEEAEEAYKSGDKFRKKTSPSMDYLKKSVSVDAACSSNPGEMEYQGVYTGSGERLFHYGPVPKGTNNIGEFLAIVHALALLKKKGSLLPVYSDSRTAISWVRNKRANTNLVEDEETKDLWEVIHRAERWLRDNSYENEVLKWETKLWGESKADFGRK